MGKPVCPWWLAYTFDNPFRSFFHKPDIIFSPYVKKGVTVADIGCGLGIFSIGLARVVGVSGKVIAVDIQQKMLSRAKLRAERAKVADRIEFSVCDENSIGITEEVDFALAFWMVHETPDVGRFIRAVYIILKPSGMLLITEPRFHVSDSDFKNETLTAENVGFTLKEQPPISLSRSALFQKAPVES